MDEPLRYYFDEHVRDAIAIGLRARGIDVLTAKEVGRAGKEIPDPIQLAYATEQKRVIVTSIIFWCEMNQGRCMKGL